jgi:hypothetical protein
MKLSIDCAQDIATVGTKLRDHPWIRMQFLRESHPRLSAFICVYLRIQQ